METDLEKGSVYKRSLDSRLRPSDYYYPRKPIRQSEPPEGGGHHGTAHWKSEYRSNVNDAARYASQKQSIGKTNIAQSPISFRQHKVEHNIIQDNTLHILPG